MVAGRGRGQGQGSMPERKHFLREVFPFRCLDFEYFDKGAQGSTVLRHDLTEIKQDKSKS